MPTKSELAHEWARWCRRHNVSFSSDDFDRVHERASFRLLSRLDGTVPAVDHVTCDFLYTRGDVALLSAAPRVAIVGSRNAGVEGQRLADWVAREVVRAGAIVFSGGAIGTDTIAHEAAVSRQRPTVCVLPSGIDVATPRRNRRLFEQIATNGCLVSAYPLGLTARPYHYHDRNALLVALSDVVVVVRARSKSGSRITGEAAIEQGKPLFVVPGSPDDPHSAGCLDLLEKGARIFRSIDDLGLHSGSAWGKLERDSDDETSSGGRHRQVLESLTQNGRVIVAALWELGGSATPDELASRVGFIPSVVAAELIELELFGHCVRAPGGTSVTLSDRIAEAMADEATR